MIKYKTTMQGTGFVIEAWEGRGQVGRIGVSQDSDAGRNFVNAVDTFMHVGNVVIVPGSRRHGIGTKLYEQAAHLACEVYHMPLGSDSVDSRSKYAEGFWRKQQTKGRAKCVHRKGQRKCVRYILSCPAPASLAGRRR